MHTYFDLHRNSDISCSIIACKASRKDHSVTGALMHDDVDLALHGQYTAIQIIKNPEIKGYGQHKVSF